jgi:hypothetical protein
MCKFIPPHSQILYIKTLHINTRLLACRSPRQNMCSTNICFRSPMAASDNIPSVQMVFFWKVFSSNGELGGVPII